MEPERWQRVEQLYHSALALEESRRDAFLNDSCAGDEALRRDVVSLLACHERAEEFLELPALEVVAKQLAGEQSYSDWLSDDPRHLVGRMVSPYRVVSKLGGGGMGIIYLAEDSRLGRNVALKFLPFGSRDPAALERLRREARAASTVNHPNICTIYDISEFEGEYFIVMEALEGQTLRYPLICLWIGAFKSATHSRPLTPKASFTGTLNRLTSSSPLAAKPRFLTSASPRKPGKKRVPASQPLPCVRSTSLAQALRLAPSPICPRNKPVAKNSTEGPMFFLLAVFFMRWPRASRRSPAPLLPSSLTPFCIRHPRLPRV